MAGKILRKLCFSKGISALRKLEDLLLENAILQVLSIPTHYWINTSYDSILVIINRLALEKCIDGLRDWINIPINWKWHQFDPCRHWPAYTSHDLMEIAKVYWLTGHDLRGNKLRFDPSHHRLTRWASADTNWCNPTSQLDWLQLSLDL